MNDLFLSLPRDDRQAGYLREQIRIWSTLVRLSRQQLDDLLLVASELLSNAVRAADADSVIDVCVEWSETGVSVRVGNRGPGFDLESLPEPSRTRHGGRGIAIMRALGTVTVKHVVHQTVVNVALRSPNVADPGQTAQDWVP